MGVLREGCSNGRKRKEQQPRKKSTRKGRVPARNGQGLEHSLQGMGALIGALDLASIGAPINRIITLI